MAAITPTIVIMLMISAAVQVFGFYLMPMTQGLTAPVPTAGAALAFLVGIGIMARIAHAGVDLSLFVPVISVLIPLGAIAVGIFAYGEVASLAKIGTLVVACVLIGFANTL